MVTEFSNLIMNTKGIVYSTNTSTTSSTSTSTSTPMLRNTS